MTPRRSNSRSTRCPTSVFPWASSTALLRFWTSAAAASSQRAPMRSGPPSAWPKERIRACIGMRAKYRKIMATSARIRAETAKLLGTTIQAWELITGFPFRCKFESEPRQALDNMLFFRNYSFTRSRKISFLPINREAPLPPMSERIYRLTKTGRDAWEQQDAAVPADYRRLLWIMDFHGHTGLLEKLVGSYPGTILNEWLDELEQLGLIEQVPAGEELERDFALETDDTQRLDGQMLREETEKATSALARTGAYLALDRLRVQRVAAKRPEDTVVLIVEDDPDQLALADLRMTIAGYR